MLKDLHDKMEKLQKTTENYTKILELNMTEVKKSVDGFDSHSLRELVNWKVKNRRRAGRRIGQTTLEEIMAKNFSNLVKDTEQW